MAFGARAELNLFCLILLAFLLGGTLSRLERRFANYRLFIGLLLSSALMLVLDSLLAAAEAPCPNADPFLVRLAATAYYLFHPAPSFVYWLYVDHYLYRDIARLRRRAAAALAAWAALAGAILVNLRTGWLFAVTEQGLRSRGPAHAAFALASACVLVAIAVWAATRFGRFPSRSVVPLIAYPLPALAGGIVQFAVPEAGLLWPASALTVMAIYMSLQNKKIATDYLTGACTRRRLDEVLDRKLRAFRAGSGLSGFLADLDDFKRINDEFGHAVGDEALAEAAAVLASSVRDRDLVCRWAGDEFVVVMDMCDPAELARVVDRVRERMARANAARRRPYRLEFSIGSGIFDPEVDADAEAFIARLDAAMYREKEAKRAFRAADRPGGAVL